MGERGGMWGKERKKDRSDRKRNNEDIRKGN